MSTTSMAPIPSPDHYVVALGPCSAWSRCQVTFPSRVAGARARSLMHSSTTKLTKRESQRSPWSGTLALRRLCDCRRQTARRTGGPPELTPNVFRYRLHRGRSINKSKRAALTPGALDKLRVTQWLPALCSSMRYSATRHFSLVEIPSKPLKSSPQESPIHQPAYQCSD